MLHLAAVGAGLSREVDEDGLAHLLGIGLGLVQVEETVETGGHVQFVGIFAGAEVFCGCSGSVGNR